MKLARYVIMTIGAALLGLGSLVSPFSGTTLARAQAGCTLSVNLSESIQAAIDQAQEGDVICLMEGTYQENLTIDKRLALRGAGREKTIVEGSELGKPVIQIESQTESVIELEGFTVAQGAAGIQIEGQAHVMIRSLTISSNWEDGLKVGDSALMTMQDSTISGNEGHGILVKDSATATVEGSAIPENGADGLKVEGSARAEVHQSSFLGNRGCGIYVESSRADVRGSLNEMRGNGADLCGYAPISLREPLIPQTRKLQVRVPQDYSSLQEAVDAVAEGGTILIAPGTYEEGLTIWKPLVLRGAGTSQTILKALPGRRLVISIPAGVVGEGASLEGLKVTASKWIGMLIWGRASLQDVSVSENWEDGLSIGGLASVTINGSSFSKNGGDGLDVGGFATVSIKGSFFSENRRRGLTARDSATVAIETSTISENGGRGIGVWDFATATVRQTQILNNGIEGIFLKYDSRVMIVDSVIQQNASWGVAAALTECGYSGNFTGRVTFEDMTPDQISGNNTSGRLNGRGNPGNHPWNRPEVPDGQVCTP